MKLIKSADHVSSSYNGIILSLLNFVIRGLNTSLTSCCCCFSIVLFMDIVICEAGFLMDVVMVSPIYHNEKQNYLVGFD